MAVDSPRYLAFRIFGDFHWPPVRTDFDDSTEDGTKKRCKGVVEVHYAGPDKTKLAAVLRWIPWQALASNGLPPPFTEDIDKAPHIQALKKEDLEDALTESTIALFRLSGTKDALNRDRHLLFRGAFLFDQFARSNDGKDTEEHDLRWALARSFLHEGKNYFSEVVIGQESDDATSGSRIRLNLALPTPGPQSGKGSTLCFALPFAAIFKPTLNAATESFPPPVEWFIAGPGANSAEQDGEGVEVAKTPVSDRRLGGFGFCPNSDSKEFLHFPRHPDKFDEYPKFHTYWLVDDQAFKKEVLGKLSDVSSEKETGFELAKADSDIGGEQWHHVRFVRHGGANQTITVFRTGARAWFATNKTITKDIRVASGPRSFKLRVPGKLNDWFTSNDEALSTELELAYAYPSDAIWSDGAASEVADGRITARLGFNGRVEKSAGKLDSKSEVDILTARFDQAIKGMRLARLDLRHISVELPQSILPEVEVHPDEPAQPVRFMLTGTIPFDIAGHNEPRRILWERQYPGRDIWSGLYLRLSLWPRNRKIASDEDATLPIKLWPALFAYNVNDAIEADLVDDPNVTSSLSPSLFQFAIAARISKGNLALHGRLGGLEFKTAGGLFADKVDEKDYSHWRFGERQPITMRLPGATDGRFQTADVDFRIRLGVTSIKPIATDIPWGDRTGRLRPLLIPIGENKGDGTFILDGRETVSGTSDRRLLADILDTGKGSPDTGSYVVVSTEPFAITKFTSQPLQERGAQDNAIVAAYDSDTRSWQVKLAAPTYHYEFPPQSAGESMDKPRRLEIEDYPPPLPPALKKPPIPPAVDDLRRRAVEFRLTPSAELWVRPSDVERGYFLPEWASYEIFRQRGDLGIGAAMEALRAEFLYGLSVGIDTARESGAARTARVAEIEALTGHPPRRLGSSDLTGDFPKRWTGLERTLARRPERLEVWAREPSSTVPFAPARFTGGVQYALRNTALHRPPLADERIKKPDEPGAVSPRVSERGLSGGALWPIESRNFFNALLDSPASIGGAIARIALSPNGGDADQKAEFLNGKLAIISETRNGFVQRHKVEIIGRIAVFWHRAKHVVVYERTVSPSAQFTPEGGLGARTRRPVLRKVSEYIELLQPIRSYPDFPTAKPASVGFLRAVRFNSKIINVDSAWSEDVGDYGWKIPLWNAYSAKQRPQVYPRPDIGFVTAAEGDGERPQATQECLEPDNLYFFADATAVDADTDAWFSRVGIDFASLPRAHPDFEPNLDQPDAGSGSRKPSASRVPRGHRRYTWRLAPAAQKTVLNAARGAEPLYAGLASITFMRSSGIDENHAATKLLAEAIKASANIKPPKSPLPYWGSSTADAPTEIAPLGDALTAFLKAVKDGSDGEVTSTARQLLAQVDQLPAALSTGSLSSHVNEFEKYRDALKTLKGFAKDGPSRCEQAIDDFVGSIKRKQLLILENIRSWESKADDHLPKVGEDFPTKEKLIEWLANEIMDLIAPALGEVAGDLGGLGTSVEKVGNIVRDVESDIERALQSAAGELAAVKANYDLGKPWSPQRLFEFQQKLATAREGIVREVVATVNEAQSRLSTELDRLAHSMGTQVSQALQAITDGRSTFMLKLGSENNAARSFLAAVDRKLGEALGESNGKDRFAELDKKLDAAIAKDTQKKYTALLQGLKTTLADGREQVKQARQTLKTLGASMDEKVETLGSAIFKTSTELTKLLKSVAAFVKEAHDEIEEIVEADLPGVKAELVGGVDEVFAAARALLDLVAGLGNAADAMVDGLLARIREATVGAQEAVKLVFELIGDLQKEIEAKLEAFKATLAPTEVRSFITLKVLTPAVTELLGSVDDEKFRKITEDNLKELRDYLADLSTHVETAFGRLSDNALGTAADAARKACEDIGGKLSDAYKFIENARSELEKRALAINKSINDILGDAAKLRELARSFDRDIRRISNDLAGSFATANAYSNRVLDLAGNLGSGGLAAAPNNILSLYAAAASAPALPNLDFARERLGYYYNQLNDVIDTTPVEAWFGRLGDELKALGLSLPFRQIGDRLIPDDLSSFDISRIFKNFSGMKLDKLFKGYKLPAGAKDAVKVTHAFDKKQFRAWVQVDVDLPISGRRALFSIGPFQLDFVNSRLLAQVRLEASKDSDKVEQSGRANLTTNIEAVVGGQSMVMLQKVAVKYEKSSGLKVEFDPKNIKLNSSFQFIQDTLGTLFPDDIGGLKIIKESGIPVGVEHEFAMPPVSLMFATSGVSNIAISNRFALVAFPDFVISDRFSLSRPDLPFIFSIFIIGGTGYITVDTEYRPFKSELMVVVEAAAGGSASLGFAFGPVTGSVFITLSIALAYRKLIGSSGGGLTVSLVLLIAGNVNVAGIIDVYISLLLRMSYRDNGQIDATGTLTISIRISRFFKIKVRANVQYKLRGGKSTTTKSVDTSTEITDQRLAKAKEKADKLLAARG